VEEGVTYIEMAASTVFNRGFTPAGQRVKWFRDELGQLWVKFQTTRSGDSAPIDRVWPADRVVEVQYAKS
jgi:hypothetical protein